MPNLPPECFILEARLQGLLLIGMLVALPTNEGYYYGNQKEKHILMTS